MNEGLVLGIDSGGSKTLVALADGSGQVVDLRRGAPANPLDSEHWAATLEAQVRPLADKPGVGSLAAGLPVYGEVDTISAAQRQAIADLAGTRPNAVFNDVDAAHIGAFAGGAGILILSGTGSMAWARDAAGVSYRVGGWGEIIGDEGSSHWIGQRILETVSQSLDGREDSTDLVEAVFAHLQIDLTHPANALEGWIAGLENRRAGIAALAPLATRVADTGDPVARGIVGAAADELARHVSAIARRASLPSAWSYAGGTFRSQLLLKMVATRIGSPPTPPRLPPIGGALLAAARLRNWQITDAWIDRLAASIEALPDLSTEQQPTH